MELTSHSLPPDFQKVLSVLLSLPFPGSRVEAQKHDQAFNSLPRAMAISSVFLQTWWQFIYFSSKECKYCCVGVLFFFLSNVTNTCAAPYKQHLVLSLQPRIPGCPILPFKAAKQITNQADWDLEQTGLQKPRLLCPLHDAVSKQVNVSLLKATVTCGWILSKLIVVKLSEAIPKI